MLIGAPSTKRGKHGYPYSYTRTDKSVDGGAMVQGLIEFDDVKVSDATTATVFSNIRHVKAVFCTPSGSATGSGTNWKVASSPAGKTSSGTYITLGFGVAINEDVSVVVLGEDPR